MVDVSDKVATQRQAHARTIIDLPAEVVAELNGDEITTKKGPVFATAIIAGVMAVRSSIVTAKYITRPALKWKP